MIEFRAGKYATPMLCRVDGTILTLAAAGASKAANAETRVVREINATEDALAIFESLEIQESVGVNWVVPVIEWVQRLPRPV